MRYRSVNCNAIKSDADNEELRADQPFVIRPMSFFSTRTAVDHGCRMR